MFVSKTKKLLYFHVPKTAGTSLRQFLFNTCKDANFFSNLSFSMFIEKYDENFAYSQIKQAVNLPAYKHLTQDESTFILKKLNLDFRDFFEFVIVRNPYDRVLSYYNFVLHKTYPTVNELLDDIESNTVDPNLQFRFQLEYIKNPITNNIKIFKYEELNECEEFLQKYIGTNEKFPKLNVTKNNFVDELNVELKTRIYKLFEEEFDILGYSK